MPGRSTLSAVLRWDEPNPAIQMRHGQRGGALLEFVIIFPLLMMLVFGIWEFGRIFDAWLVATNAAREGARYGVASPLTGSAFETYVQNRVLAYVGSGYGTNRLNSGDVHITRTDIQVDRAATSGPVTVTVAATVDIWAPAVAPLMGRDTFTVSAWSTMRQ